MDSLSSVTIDASVLAAPSVNCDKDEAFQYVETLQDWSKLLEEPWIAIYMSERASEVLIEEGLFPLRNHLRNLFQQHGIVEYSVNDIAKLAEKLLSYTPSFETYYRVRDILCEQLETDPDVICISTYTGLQSELARCIALIAILRKNCFQPLGGHSLILRKAPQQRIKLKAQIHDIEHTRNDILNLPNPPEFFQGEVLVCEDFSGLLRSLDESAIFVNASDDFGIMIAIKIALFKQEINLGINPNWDSINIPKIGSKFRELCQEICAEQNNSIPPKILRSIVETIQGENLADVHALEKGNGKNTSQKIRNADNAKAQRRDIDQEFHLHYWECADGTVELASVVYHNDFSIPE